MKNDFGQFSEGLVELAHEMWEFRTCQRSDGSYYGTGGQCRKGTETDKPEKERKEGKGGGADSVLTKEVMGGLDQMREFQDPNPANEDFIADAQARIDGVKGGIDGLVKMEDKAMALDDKWADLDDKVKNLEAKAEKKLDKINELDDKVRDLREKSFDQSDINTFTKMQEKALKLEDKVDAELEKEFPDFKKAKEDRKKAFDEWDKETKGELTDGTPKHKEYQKSQEKLDDVKSRKLGGEGYDEIKEKYTKETIAKRDKIQDSYALLQDKTTAVRQNIDGVAGEYYRNGRPSLAVQQGYGTKYGGGKNAYDKQVDKSVDQIYNNLKAMGITPPSKSVIESQVLQYNSGDIDKSQLYQEITQ